jgi:monoamine oxidase
VPLRVANQLGDRVVLSSPVRSITQAASGATVVSDAVTVSAKQVVVAMPPALAQRISYDPPLPAIRDQLCQHMPQGSLMKFEAIYDSPWWRAKGLTGQAVSEDGPVKATFDSSPSDGNPGILLGFVGGHEARTYGQRPESDLRDDALKQFALFFGDEALKPKQTLLKNWSAEVWSRGCPVAVLGPGTLVDFGSALREPVGRIHWAGTETSDYWNGYMDGAVRSGERVAQEVGALL